MNAQGTLKVWGEIIVALATGVVSSLLLLFFSTIDLQIILLLGLNTILVILLLFSLRIQSRLLYFVLSSQKEKKNSSPKAILLENMMDSLRLYGFIKSREEEKKMRAVLERDAIYLRGQNFYEIFTKGIIKVQKRFLLLNDHPFKPFSDIVLSYVQEEAEYIVINAIPDQLYSKEDIDRRIRLIRAKDMEYYLLPDEDVHLALLIFDEKVALVYTTPFGRGSCSNFSEALLFGEPESLQLMTKLFFHVLKIAKNYSRRRGIDTISILESLQDFYAPTLRAQ